MEKKINKYHKEQTKNINKILNVKNNYNIKFNNNNYICLYQNNKLIIAGEYYFHGIYQTNTKLWIWSSSIPGVQLKYYDRVKEIKKNDFLFEGNKSEKEMFYFQFLTNDVLLITDNKMLNWINELLIYLNNDLFYFNPVHFENNIQFITLSNIVEQYA